MNVMKCSVKADNAPMKSSLIFSRFQRDFDLSSYLKHVLQPCITANNIDNTWDVYLLVVFSFNGYINIKCEVAINCMFICIMVVF